jgi:glycosyltransferase involved in cell wall biosynthesis
MKLTFFMDSTARGGGTRVLFELSNRLCSMGSSVEIVSFAPYPDWFILKAPFREIREAFEATDAWSAGRVVVSHLYLIPLVWAAFPSANVLWFCQGYDPYTTARALRDDYEEPPELLEALGLPFPCVAVSRSVQSILRSRGKDSAHVPCGLSRESFYERVPAAPPSKKRVALVLDPDILNKGLQVARQALELLEGPVEAVLVTRNERWQPSFQTFVYEVHRRPELGRIAEIVASCHVLLCPSWYEGLGLPALEAMALGVPVVSTRNGGIDDYGRHEENCLLANVGDSQGLARQLERIFSDPELCRRLRAAGLETTAEGFDWDESARAFARACLEAPAATCPAGLDMNHLVERLEACGHFATIETVREEAALYRQVCELPSITSGADKRARLLELRERCRARLNPHRPVVQACFDACQVMLAFPEQPVKLSSFRCL